MESDKAHPIEPMVNIAMLTYNGFFLPMRSLTGPHTSCAMAKPIRNPVIVNSTFPPNAFSMVGIAGK